MYSHTIMIISENVDLNYFLDNIQPHNHPGRCTTSAKKGNNDNIIVHIS